MTKINTSAVDFIFVGGSSVEDKETDELVLKIKDLTSLPVVLFPGNYQQITSHADAILFLSLILHNAVRPTAMTHKNNLKK
mgnify:CR=1 FL=1